MNNHRITCGLVACYVAAVFLTGCIPEDSLQWSEDGSVGLLRVEGALYLVDGQTGDLTEIARENVQILPDISKDGNLVAYSQQVKCNSLSEGLKLLPPGQVKNRILCRANEKACVGCGRAGQQRIFISR